MMGNRVDELIDRYADALWRIYNDQTASDYTFEGVLNAFTTDLLMTEVLEENTNKETLGEQAT